MKLSDFSFAPQAQPSIQAKAEQPAHPGRTAKELFELAAATWGSRPALRDAGGTLTYRELDVLTARLGRFLQNLGVGPECFVGIMMERTNLAIAAMLAILRAGGAYVPIDPSLPLPRRRDMLRDCGALVLLSQAAFLADMNTLHWECPQLDHIVCLDAGDFIGLCEAPGELMSTELWDFVAAGGGDDIESGGWKSPYTGQWLSREIMEGYGDNARLKLAPLLGPGSRVLEVGVASGITMRQVAPLCASYLGLDIAQSVLDRARLEADQRGLANVSLSLMRADEIGRLPAGAFDCVIMNSVMECFPGLNYLRQVLRLCLERLTPGGHLFLGNVWDLERRDALTESLEAFARQTVGQGYSTKTDMSGELFVAKAFFKDWAAVAGRQGQALTLEFSDMQADERELSAYGYDLLITKGAAGSPEQGPGKGMWAAGDFAGLPDTPPPTSLQASNAAYALFTSGTSGRPKGVVLEHGNLVNLIEHLTEQLFAPLAAEDAAVLPRPLNVALIASFSFDASLQSIFGALLGGHTLHITADEVRRDPGLLHAFLEERAIDILDGTPGLLAMLLDHWESTDTSSRVRTLIAGGEVLPSEYLERFYAKEGHARSRVVNAYGPTECCVDATLHLLNSANWREHPLIPIGTPVKGTEVFIVDAQGRLLPTGVPGEILIAGKSVGRGYLNSPELTKERFVPHPLDPAGRAYRSGDLGRWRKEGVLEYLRRADSQVKVRGYRVECGEIETALRAYPGVREAVVAVGDFLGDHVSSLAAYLVADQEVTPTGLREYLLRKLPQFMVPAYFVRLDKVPLTMSGKVDRKALPSPVAAAQGPQAPSPPQTPTEHRLAEIWSALLHQKQVDAQADFFAQGGHSILAVRLVSLVEKAFGVKLRLDHLFASATLRGVAAFIDREVKSGSGQAWSPLVTAQAKGRRPPLFCFHPVGGNILCYRHLAGLLSPEQPLHMIQSLGLVEGQEALGSVEELAAYYLAVIVRQFPQGPYALAGWSFGGLVAWESARQLLAQGRRVSSLVLLDAVAVPDGIAELMARDEAEYLATIFAEVLPLEVGRLRALDSEGRLEYIMTLGLKHGVFPPDTDRAHMLRLLALFRANGLAAVRYRAPALELPALLVRPRESSPAALTLPDDPLQGWGQRALGGVRLCTVPGNHASMLFPPQVEAVAAVLDPYLREAAGASGEESGHGR